MVKKLYSNQCLWCYSTVNNIDTNDRTSDVEEVYQAKQMKGVVAVLQYIA